MRKIRFIMLALMTVICVTSAKAQQPNEKQKVSREQIVETLAKHLANELALDDKTNDKFIETYINYRKELWTIAPKHDRKKHKTSETEEQAAQNMQQKFERSQKMLDIRTKYYKQFSKFMTQKQIELMYNKEKNMMQRLKQRYDKRPHMKDRR